jgi:hypothetical protein
LTYVLEGSFSELVQTASAYAQGQQAASVDPHLRKYFSFLRLGKIKETEKYLNRVSPSFVGEKKE